MVPCISSPTLARLTLGAFHDAARLHICLLQDLSSDVSAASDSGAHERVGHALAFLAQACALLPTWSPTLQAYLKSLRSPDMSRHV